MSDADAARKRFATGGFLARLFTLGTILLVSPLLLALLQDSCASNAGGCFGLTATHIFSTIFPYVMLAGGLLIGYGMKRFADNKKEESENEEDDSVPDQPENTEKT